MNREPVWAARRRTDMRLAVASAALVLMAAGCGAVTYAAPDQSSTPVGKPTALRPTISVTAGVEDRLIRLGVGQQLVVRPAPGRPGNASAQVDPPGSRVLRAAGGEAGSGWRFVATAPGTVRLLVTYGPQCVAGELCPLYRGVLSRLTVLVAR